MESDAVMAEKKEKDEASVSQRLAEKIVAKAGRIKYIVLGVLVVALLIVGVIAVMRHNADTRQANSENALYLAKMEVYNKPDGDYKAVLGKVAKDYAGLPAAAGALSAMFSIAAEKNDYAAAVDYGREFIRGFPQHAFAPSIRLGLGHVLMNTGRLSEARPEIEAAIRAAGGISPMATLAMAQLDLLEAEAKGDADSPQVIRARDAFTTIRTSALSRSAYWPEPVMRIADFSLVLVNDYMAGYQHPAPIAAASVGDVSALDIDVGAVALPPVDAVAEAEDQEEPAAVE